MGLSDILAGLSGAIHGSQNYDKDEEEKARQKREDAMKAVLAQLQIQEHMDRMGATPWTAEKALSTSLGGRPELSDTVGLTSKQDLDPTVPRIKMPKGLDEQPFMNTAPFDPMNQIVSTPIPPAPPQADSRRSRAMNAVAETSGSSRAPMTPTAPDAMAMLTGMKPLASLSSNDGREERLVNENAMSGPRVTMPNAITGADDEYSLYPGGSTQRADDMFSARQAATEKRQQANEALRAREKADAAALQNKRIHRLIVAEYQRTKDPMLAPYINDRDVGSTEEGQYAEVWKAYQAQLGRNSTESIAANSQAGLERRAAQAKKTQDNETGEAWYYSMFPAPGEKESPEFVTATRAFELLKRSNPKADASELLTRVMRGMTQKGLQGKTAALTGKADASTDAEIKKQDIIKKLSSGSSVAPGTPSGSAPTVPAAPTKPAKHRTVTVNGRTFDLPNQ